MDLGLTDKTCVVTGASRGIGLETAKLLGEEGAQVLLVGRDEGRLTDAQHACGQRAAYVVADVADPDAAAAVVAEAERRLGPVDVLVNNAGYTEAKAIDELTEADWEHQWQLHVMGPMRLMRAAAPGMADRGWGRIVNVSSSSGKRPSLSNVSYSVTKSAVLSLSRAFAQQYAPRGVNVNAVAPGPLDSEMWLADGGLAEQYAARAGVSTEELLEQTRAKQPSGRFGRPQEIARVIVGLCGTLGDNVVGAAWSADGGAVPVII